MIRGFIHSACCLPFARPRGTTQERRELLAHQAPAPSSQPATAPMLGPAEGGRGGSGSRRSGRLNPEDEQLLAQMSKAKNTFQGQFDEYERSKGPALGQFLKSMVEDYNCRHPGMNARYAKDFDSMFDMVEKDRTRLETGPMHFIATNSAGAHHSTWRFQSHGGEITAIGIESLDERSTNMGRTALDFCALFESRPGLVKSGILVGTGAQKDENACAVFSAGFLNTFRKHPDHFDTLSRDVHRMGKGEPVVRLPAADIGSDDGNFRTYGDHTRAFQLLPAHAFKNSQSKSELKEYRQLAPEAASKPVSKRGETIEQRLTRLTDLEHPLDEAERVDLARGSDKKRIHMLDSAIKHVERGG